jgi:hypothetical protein
LISTNSLLRFRKLIEEGAQEGLDAIKAFKK